MTTNNDKIKSYLTLFGLDEYFSEDELRSSYAALAKLNHPDLSKDPSTEMRMVIVNEAYSCLKDLAGKLTPGKRPVKARDPAYDHYYKAFHTMKQAFEEYYGESEEKKNTGNNTLLRQRLSEAKQEFAFIVNEIAYNDWTSDAIDKIFSINRWLA